MSITIAPAGGDVGDSPTGGWRSEEWVNCAD